MEQTLTIKAAGIDFFAQQSGEQPHAVLVHGFGGDLHMWDLLYSALENKLPALRYDLRGFGRSIDNSKTEFNHATDLLAILDAVNIEQCDLIGLSMGGAIALNFAIDYPERVRNLVLISPGIVAWEWSDAWKTLSRPITAKARAGLMDEARYLWWQHPFFATTRASAAAEILRESIFNFSGAQWIHDYHQLMLSDVERLHTLKARTLLLTGQLDFEDFRLTADLIEASAPNVTRIDWSGYGHLLNLENAAGCAREILTFLNSAH